MVLTFQLWIFPFLVEIYPRHRRTWCLHSKLIRYAKVCVQCSDFLERGQLLSEKLPRDKSNLAKLESSLRKFYVRHRELGDNCFANYHDFVTIWRSSREFFTTDFDFTNFNQSAIRRVSLTKKNMLTFPEHLMSLGFYESSYIVQVLVLSVFVLFCLCMFPCGVCLILLLPLVAMLNVWSTWI